MQNQTQEHTVQLYERCRFLLLHKETWQDHSPVRNYDNISQSLRKIEGHWKASQKDTFNFLFPYEELQYEISKKHGTFVKIKEYTTILTTKQKLSLFYGYLSTRKLKEYIKKALQMQGYFAKNFFALLEQRLDVAVYRSGFAPTIRAARQLCLHQKIVVNTQICTAPSTFLKPGDIVHVVYTPNTTDDIPTEFQSKSTGATQKQRQSLFRCNLYLQSLGDTTSSLQEATTLISTINFVLHVMKKRILSRYSITQVQLKIPQYQILGQKETFAPLLKHNTTLLQQMVSQNPLFIYIAKMCALSPVLRKEMQYYLKEKEQKLNSMNGLFKKNRTVNPLHLEISRPTTTFIYLFSPQRIELPFMFDIDVLKKLIKI